MESLIIYIMIYIFFDFVSPAVKYFLTFGRSASIPKQKFMNKEQFSKNLSSSVSIIYIVN
tara:strand:- start:148 stop:327 length:180 start_codon:yes stop_codon:yes gene_type:complete